MLSETSSELLSDWAYWLRYITDQSVSFSELSPEPGNSPLPAQFQQREGPQPIKVQTEGNWGSGFVFFYNLGRCQAQKRGPVNLPSVAWNIFASVSLGRNTHITVLFKCYLVHSKLSVSIIIAAVSLSIIINFKYTYMQLENYVPLYNLKGRKFGEFHCYYPCWVLLKSYRHNYEWLKSSEDFLTVAH